MTSRRGTGKPLTFFYTVCKLTGEEVVEANKTTAQKRGILPKHIPCTEFSVSDFNPIHVSQGRLVLFLLTCIYSIVLALIKLSTVYQLFTEGFYDYIIQRVERVDFLCGKLGIF